MARKKQRRYRVQRRMKVWVSTIIGADSLEDALVKARQTNLDDFLVETTDDFGNETEVIDWDPLDGLSVGEEWDE